MRRLHLPGRAARWAPRAIAASAVAALGGASPAAAQPWILNPASGQADLINQLFWLTLVLAAIVFVLVEGLLIYSSLRFRRRAPLPVAEPPQIHGNTRLEVMWAIVPALLLVGLFGVSAVRLGELHQVPDDAMRVSVTGRQFLWEFNYADADVRTTNELRVPVGTPVVAEVTSGDVIHSFWIPDLHGKIDANPGRLTRIWFQASKEGVYRGVCAELCGAGHAQMLFRVQAMPRAEFDQWLQQQRAGGAPAAVAPPGAGVAGADEGRALFAQKGCGACHIAQGVPGAVGTVGPSLNGIATRNRIAAGVVPNNSPEDLKRWIMNPQALKPGTAMPNLGLSDDEATKIVAFLLTLR